MPPPAFVLPSDRPLPAPAVRDAADYAPVLHALAEEAPREIIALLMRQAVAWEHAGATLSFHDAVNKARADLDALEGLLDAMRPAPTPLRARIEKSLLALDHPPLLVALHERLMNGTALAPQATVLRRAAGNPSRPDETSALRWDDPRWALLVLDPNVPNTAAALLDAAPNNWRWTALPVQQGLTLPGGRATWILGADHHPVVAALLQRQWGLARRLVDRFALSDQADRDAAAHAIGHAFFDVRPSDAPVVLKQATAWIQWVLHRRSSGANTHRVFSYRQQQPVRSGSLRSIAANATAPAPRTMDVTLDTLVLHGLTGLADDGGAPAHRKAWKAHVTLWATLWKNTGGPHDPTSATLSLCQAVGAQCGRRTDPSALAHVLDAWLSLCVRADETAGRPGWWTLSAPADGASDPSPSTGAPTTTAIAVGAKIPASVWDTVVRRAIQEQSSVGGGLLVQKLLDTLPAGTPLPLPAVHRLVMGLMRALPWLDSRPARSVKTPIPWSEAIQGTLEMCIAHLDPSQRAPVRAWLEQARSRLMAMAHDSAPGGPSMTRTRSAVEQAELLWTALVDGAAGAAHTTPRAVRRL